MKKILIYFVVLLIFSCSKNQKSNDIKVKISELEVSGISEENTNYAKGVSAPFAGLINNDYLLIAGGCNFPNIPVAEGGKKVYYDDIFITKLNETDKLEFKKIGSLPQPLAYGISLPYKDKLYLIGGNNAEGNNEKIYELSLQKDSLIIKEKASLKIALDNFSGDIINDEIYFSGNNEFGVFNIINNKIEYQKTPFSNKRLQTVSVLNKDKYYLFSGFSLTSPKELAKVNGDLWTYNIQSKKWENQPNLKDEQGEEITFSGGNGVALSDKLFLLGNGVNKQIFQEALQRDSLANQYLVNGKTKLYDSIISIKNEYLKHPKEWYKFNPSLYVFNTENNSLKKVTTDTENLAKAGAVWVKTKYGIFQINGEEKPGIRTPKIIKIQVYEK